MKFFIYFKNLLVKENGSLEKNLNIYLLILKKNLLIEFLKN